MTPLLAPFLSASLKKKRQPIAYNLWGKAHHEEVKAAYARRCLIKMPQKEKKLTVRMAVTRDLFLKLPKATQDEWKDKAIEQHEAYLGEQSKEAELGIDDPLSRQR